MSKTTLSKKISNIISKQIKVSKINLNDGINKTRNWDSIGNLNILLAIEKELDIKFKTKEFNSLINFRNILKNVKSKIKK